MSRPRSSEPSTPDPAQTPPKADIEQPPQEASPQLFEMVIPSSVYVNREYFAARDAISARDGIHKNLRAALASAEGKSVVVKIFHQ